MRFNCICTSVYLLSRDLAHMRGRETPQLHVDSSVEEPKCDVFVETFTDGFITLLYFIDFGYPDVEDLS